MTLLCSVLRSDTGGPVDTLRHSHFLQWLGIRRDARFKDGLTTIATPRLLSELELG